MQSLCGLSRGTRWVDPAAAAPPLIQTAPPRLPGAWPAASAHVSGPLSQMHVSQKHGHGQGAGSTVWQYYHSFKCVLAWALRSAYYCSDALRRCHASIPSAQSIILLIPGL